MVAHLARVLLELRRLGLVVVRLGGREIGLERHLRVDDDVLPAGKVDHDVGPKAPALVVGRRHLRLEVAVLDHARELDDALQLDLAPLAAHVRRPQRGDQVAGALGQRGDLLLERAVVLAARLLERLRLEVDLLERLLDRLDELLDGELARRQVLARLHLHALELGPRELEERGVVLAQRLAREGLERVCELLARLVQRLEPLLVRPPLVVELLLDPNRAAVRGEPPDEGAGGETDEDACNDHLGPRTVATGPDGTFWTTKMPDPTNPRVHWIRQGDSKGGSRRRSRGIQREKDRSLRRFVPAQTVGVARYHRASPWRRRTAPHLHRGRSRRRRRAGARAPARRSAATASGSGSRSPSCS